MCTQCQFVTKPKKVKKAVKTHSKYVEERSPTRVSEETPTHIG